MAITRKPQPTLVEQIINKGGSTPREQTNTSTETIPLKLNVPAKLLEEVDRICKASLVLKKRHAWILEAIVEKVAKDKL